jgi:MYXO-CTERM domain-containing protein
MSGAPPVGQNRQVRQRLVVAATLVCAASMLGLGLWAFLDPPSFAGFVDFPPYNEHLIHDAGAFQIGIGAALLVALWLSDGLVVALTGFAVAGGLHTIAHAIDRHLGGHDSDVPSLAVLTLVALAAIAARIRRRTS